MTEEAARSLFDIVGNTPLVELDSFSSGNSSIFAKLEFMNPSGSIKDRIVSFMIDDAIANDELEGRLIEPSSGNTAISLAMYSSRLDLDLTIVMPKDVSSERKKILLGFDVDLVFSDPASGVNGAVEKARSMREADEEFFMLDQYSNEMNPRAHYESTGREVVDQIDRVDYFVVGLGTGGTMMGAGKRIREEFPDAELVGIQPEPSENLDGLRNMENGFIPEVIDEDLVDRSLLSRNDEAFEYMKKVRKNEGFFVGPSSGTAAAKAEQVAEETDRANVVTVFPDAGWKYMSYDAAFEDYESDNEVSGTLW